MNVGRTNIVLSLLLAGLLALLVLASRDNARPNYQLRLGNDMTSSPAYTPFARNEHLPHGRTMQAPVAGTIARGQMPLHYQATPEDALRAGEELQSPYSANDDESAQARDRGAVVFQSFCATCHGGGGLGDGPVSKRGFPPPPSLLTGKSLEMKDGQLFHILTYGQVNMPTFAVELPASRRWDVIHYIRHLQSQAAQQAPTDSQPATPSTSSEPDPAQQDTNEPEPQP